MISAMMLMTTMMILTVKWIVTDLSLINSFAETGGGLQSLRATLQDICDKGRESEDSVFDLSGTCTVSCFHATFSAFCHMTTIVRSHAVRQLRRLWVRVVAAAAAQYRHSCRAAPQRRGLEVQR